MKKVGDEVQLLISTTHGGKSIPRSGRVDKVFSCGGIIVELNCGGLIKIGAFEVFHLDILAEAPKGAVWVHNETREVSFVSPEMPEGYDWTKFEAV